MKQSTIFEERSPFESLERARRQRLLIPTINFLLLVTVPIAIPFAVLAFTMPSWQSAAALAQTLLWIPVGLLARRLADRDQTEVGGFLLIFYFLFLIAGNGILIEGLFPAVAPAFAPFLVMAGMVMGSAGGYSLVALGSIMWLGSWALVSSHVIQQISAPAPLLAVLVGVIIILSFITVAFLSQLATRDLRHALSDATYDLVRANEKLSDASKLKSQFMARTSHELRTPLNSIIGYTDLALRKIYGPLTAIQHDSLFRVLSNAKRLLLLINDILDLSKVEAGELLLLEAPFPTNRLYDVVEVTLGKRAREKGLNFTTRISPDLPERMLGDENRLAQILLNLTDNAIKFTDNGSVSVQIECVDDGRWRMKVNDSGCGIREEDLDSIFEEFHRVDDATIDPLKQGSGLGLPISRHLVQLMKGEIRVTSQKGKGSEFEVILPLRKAEKLTVI